MKLLFWLQKWVLPTMYEFWISLFSGIFATTTLIGFDIVISRYLRHTILYPLFEHYYVGFVVIGIVAIFVWMNLVTVLVNTIYDKNNWLKITSDSYFL